MAAPYALQRASWPQTHMDTGTGYQHQGAQSDTDGVKTMYGVWPDAHGCMSSSQQCQPQPASLQCVPYIPQHVRTHNQAIVRHPSADSALALRPHQPTLSIPAFLPQSKASPAELAIFGEQFVAADIMETFYIRERPTKPQPGDGVIRTPVIGQPGMFQDGFKVDMAEHWMSFERVLKDLPDNNALCCQRRKKAAFNPTILICTGSAIDASKLVATVRKAGDKKAIIELEKKAQTEYTVEGDLVQRNYMIKLNNVQVAQVSNDDVDARVAVTTRHSYSVKVAPGTDCVLMIAAAMAVEDIYTP